MVLQFFPVLSQYCNTLPSGTVDASTVGAMVPGLLGLPLVYVPFFGVGAAGYTGITEFTITNNCAGSPEQPLKTGVTNK